jgi:hypothetical protein
MVDLIAFVGALGLGVAAAIVLSVLWWGSCVFLGTTSSSIGLGGPSDGGVFALARIRRKEGWQWPAAR